MFGHDLGVEILGGLIVALIIGIVTLSYKVYALVKERDDKREEAQTKKCETCDKHDSFVNEINNMKLLEVRWETTIVGQIANIVANVDRIEKMLNEALNGVNTEDGLWKRVRLLESLVLNNNKKGA